MTTARPRVDVWMGKDRAERNKVSEQSESASGARLARRLRASRIGQVHHVLGLFLEDRLVFHDELRSGRRCGGGQQQGS